MPFDPKAADFLVAVVGTGSMGRGIMPVAAQGGMRVLAFDEQPEAAKAAMAHVANMIETQVAKGRLAADAGQAARDRIGLARDPAVLAEANVIIEARAARRQTGAVCRARRHDRARHDHCLGLPGAPRAVCGMHFLNPVPLMRLVQIIPGLKTAAWVSEALSSLARRRAREPVLCTDMPGVPGR
jgi:3-hydroxybutyryl-CoA dehydrogenase